MDLYFLRHGLAGQHGDPKYKDDSLRPLTTEGCKKMHCAAQGMKALGLRFDAIFSSPYLRARQTAEIVAQSYKIKSKKMLLTDNLLPPASIEKLLKEVSLIGNARGQAPIKSILCVGHEPHLTEMISSLLRSNKPLPIDFKKGSLCSLSLNQPLGRGSTVLNWLITSSQLCHSGEKSSKRTLTVVRRNLD